MGERTAPIRRARGIRASAPALALLVLAALPLLFASSAGAEIVPIVPSENTVSHLEERAEKIEAELAGKPDDEGLIAKLTRARISVADAMINGGASRSKVGVEEIKQQLAFVAVDWSKYRKVARKPSTSLATEVAPELFQLAELSSGVEEAFKYVKAAAAAERIVVEGRPSVGSWSTLAYYELFAQHYNAADEAFAKATARMKTENERKRFEKKFKEVEKNAREFGKQLGHR